MNEPNRIGLTPLTAQKLDEILAELNPDIDSKKEAFKLIKFDIYRLAIAIGIKENKTPSALNDKSNTAFRVNELDPDKTLYTVVDCLGVCPYETTIYGYIEQLAELGIKEFYGHLQQRGELPLTEYLLGES